MCGRGSARAVKRIGPQSRSSGGGAVEEGMKQRGVTVDGGAGRRLGAAGRPIELEQAGSQSTC